MPKPDILDETLVDLLEAGAPLGDAVRIALWKRSVRLGTTTEKHSRSAVSEFAARHGFNRSNLAATLYSGRTPTEPMIAALVMELGGTAETWRQMIWEAAAPRAAVG
jgi:hypothetical protein